MLHIYKSGAGSGKTYTLVREYLRLALRHEEAFRHILAITFTNKAAGEMKTRVLDALEGIARGEPRYEPLMRELCERLETDVATLQKKSESTVKRMLHEYADIAIGTIDSFVHRLVRMYAADLRVDYSFGVEMDKESLLNETVDELLAQAGDKNPELTKALVEFAEDRITEGKGWRIEHELTYLGIELFNDEARPFLNRLKNLQYSDMEQVRLMLKEKISQFNNRLKKYGSDAMKYISDAGLTAEQFRYKSSGIYGFFEKYAGGYHPPEPLGNTRVKEAIKQDKWGDEVPVDLQNTLRDIYQGIEALWAKNGSEYRLCQLLYRNFYALMLMADLERTLERIKKDKNILYIGDLQHKVYDIVRLQDTPVIYERLGEWYDHILIDEFQDTSLLQFRNLLPLIENALLKNKDNLIVGDAKQAIYRFRGGEVAQFISLPRIYGSERDSQLRAREVVIHNFSKKPEFLNRNFRSREEIINFNNNFFDAVLKCNGEIIRTAYANHRQENGSGKKGGYVNIVFIENNERAETSDADAGHTHTLEAIQMSLAKGYRYRDVAVLCMINEHASNVAAYLLRAGVPVVSSDSLLLNQSPQVNLIIADIRMRHQPGNLLYRLEWVRTLFNCSNENVPFDRINWHLAINDFQLQVAALANLELEVTDRYESSIPDRILRVARKYQIDFSDPFVQFFLDEVVAANERFGMRVEEFLEWWDTAGCKKSVVCPENTDAVRIMTVHKSKGLQFPVVIFADAWGEISPRKKYYWSEWHGNNPIHEKMPIVLLPNNKTIEQTPFADLYNRERASAMLDAVNLLYVATTRAEDALFIFTTATNSEIKDVNSYQALITKALENMFGYDGGASVSLGEFPQANVRKNETDVAIKVEPYRPSRRLLHEIGARWRPEWIMSRNTLQRIEKGNLLHEVLCAIRYAGDEEQVIHRYRSFAGGAWEAKWEEIIKGIVYHPELAAYFTNQWRVVNEHRIICGSEVYIPDRIVIQTDDCVIIDYKTGEPDKNHETQLDVYASVLTRAGKNVRKRILIYTNTLLIKSW
ncbi:MAG: UvrD-helicase domain-containing protein [Chitinophagales bacterium]|nr:UvrD-helicase domain-containing protein [Chitinophagales bacterium]